MHIDLVHRRAPAVGARPDAVERFGFGGHNGCLVIGPSE